MMHRKDISTFISKILISIVLLGTVVFQTRAAEKTTENHFPEESSAPRPRNSGEALPEDTIPAFRGFAVSIDAVGAGQLLLGDYGQMEAALRINMKDKYFPILEIGYGKADKEDETKYNHFKTSAPYARIGLDFNVLKNKHDLYRLYGGFRYAFTSYKYDVSNSQVTDPVWGNQAPFSFTGQKGSMHWLEFAVGTDVTIAGPFHLGWSLRYKRRLFHTEGEIGPAWYVPGYGRNGNSCLGGTFNLILEF